MPAPVPLHARRTVRAMGQAVRVGVVAVAVFVPCTVLAKDQSCAFRARGPLTLAFGDLPTQPTTVVKQATGPSGSLEVGDCHFAVNLRVRFPNARGRLTHADGKSVIPYTLAVEPGQLQGPGNFAHTRIRITATIAPDAYRNARPGLYSEKDITVEVTP